MINWKVRIKNKAFWVSFIPAVLLFAQVLLKAFGVVDFDFEGLSKYLLMLVDCIFSILAIVGVIEDPTTKGISDSDNAMNYEEPK